MIAVQTLCYEIRGVARGGPGWARAPPIFLAPTPKKTIAEGDPQKVDFLIILKFPAAPLYVLFVIVLIKSIEKLDQSKKLTDL